MRALIVAIAALLLATPAATAHGDYLDFGERPSFIDGKAVTLGPEHVPQVHYAWGVEDNPVMVAHWALQEWSRHTRNTKPTRVAAEWLRDRQRADGAWTYAFDFDAVGLPMRAPWISAMAQGMGISVLVRAHQLHPHRYLRAARRALIPFTRSVRDGGMRSNWDGRPWYEEYPGTPSQHVLNGFEFALIGLHDLAGDSRRAKRLWRVGVASLAARIAVFDAPELRTQWYAAFGRGRAPVGPGYRHEHALLTRTIAALTGSRALRRFAARWTVND